MEEPGADAASPESQLGGSGTGPGGPNPTGPFVGIEPDRIVDAGEGEPSGGDDDPAVTESAGEVTLLAREFRALRETFERRVLESDRLIGDLQERVENLQRAQVMGWMKPILQQFAQLHADLINSSHECRVRDEQVAADDFAYYASVLEQTFDHFSLESVGAEAGGRFEPMTQAAVLRKETSDPDLDQTIASVKRQGFREVGEQRAMIPARVVIWGYRNPGPSDTKGEDFESRGAAPMPAGAPSTEDPVEPQVSESNQPTATGTDQDTH